MQIFTVSQVNTYIKAVLDEIPPVQNIYISGEISNFKHYFQSGHMYFTLKDAGSQLKCVMFSGDNYKLKFTPENGMKVICFGKVGVYERDGVYQLYCRDMQPHGTGSLQLAFEQMKDKLEKEGLFSEQYKKPIPVYPERIGVATSNMGAAVEDIKNVISRRYPIAEIIIVPTVVQGDTATQDIVSSIEFLDNIVNVDTIIVGRGGGSIEDLWAFNTEEVARAVFNCKTPIISAVGHETDYTICDFVADLRAPTPSAAAELAVPDIKNLIYNINSLSMQVERVVDSKISKAEDRIKSLMESTAVSNRIFVINQAIDNIIQLNEKMFSVVKDSIEARRQSTVKRAFTINALSPINTLARGYSLTYKEKGLVQSADDVFPEDRITIRLNDGMINAVVTEVNKNE